MKQEKNPGPKNNLGDGIVSHVKNYKVHKHIKITHLDGNILQNNQMVLHRIVRQLKWNSGGSQLPYVRFLENGVGHQTYTWTDVTQSLINAYTPNQARDREAIRVLKLCMKPV